MYYQYKIQQVVDQNAFMKDVVPHFFSFSKYASFTRQITGWNFNRKGTGPDRGSYYHELFLRGRPHLVKFMKREVTGQMKVKPPSANDSGRKGDDSSWDEPDLFELSKKCPLRDSSSDDRMTSVALTAGPDESQQQFVSQAGANQHRHPPAVENGYRSSNSATMHPPAGHHYVHHHNGYQQWAAPDASHSNHFPPPAHYYAQPIPVQQGQEPSQYSEQERYSVHRLHEQHRSSFLFNPPPSAHSHSQYDSSGTHYFGQQQGHQNQNAANPPWQSYSDWEQHRNHQQQQQQHRDNGHNHAGGTTHKIHDGPTSTSDHHEYTAEQQATLNDGNLEAGPGPAGQHNDTEVSPLPLQFQPPTGSRTKDLSIHHDHLPSLDEEQRASLLSILGTAVDGKSPSNDGKDKDANGDCNSVDKDDDKGNTDASEDDADIDVSPIKFSSN